MNYLLALALLFSSSVALAWNQKGHEVVGEIAYAHLTAKAKKTIERDYLNAWGPKYKQRPFAEVAFWADEIRMRGVKAFNAWHYAGLPYSPDGTATKPEQRKNNVYWAIEESLKTLKSEDASGVEKALFLRFLLHLVGDVHQPLHCAERFTQNHPKGDRGGNFFRVPYSYAVQNLHKFWDMAAGALDNGTYQQNAKRIQKQYPKSEFTEELKVKTSKEWCEESHALARRLAYATPEGQIPNKKYVLDVQNASEKRLALAGYRLAQELNKIFR